MLVSIATCLIYPIFPVVCNYRGGGEAPLADELAWDDDGVWRMQKKGTTASVMLGGYIQSWAKYSFGGLVLICTHTIFDLRRYRGRVH